MSWRTGWTAVVDMCGRHLLIEYFGCEPEVLDDEAAIRALMREAVRAAGAAEVAAIFHRFAPQGVSGVVVIEESHLSIHTWPEYGYAAIDFYTCGDCSPERADAVLRRGLSAREVEVMTVQRGLPGDRSMRLDTHTVERARGVREAASAGASARAGTDG